MQLTIPVVFEAWIGGPLGPSYKVALEGSSVVYEVYEQDYVLHNRETVKPSSAQWSRFLHRLDEIGVWRWQEEYDTTDPHDETNWSLSLSHHGRHVVSRGEGQYAPGFVDYLRAVRDLLGGRQFA